MKIRPIRFNPCPIPPATQPNAMIAKLLLKFAQADIRLTIEPHANGALLSAQADLGGEKYITEHLLTPIGAEYGDERLAQQLELILRQYEILKARHAPAHP